MEKEHSYTYKDHNANGCKVQGWTWRNIGQPFLIWFLTEELREQQYGGFVGFEMCVCVFFFQTSLSPFLTLGPMFYQTNSAFSLSLSLSPLGNWVLLKDDDMTTHLSLSSLHLSISHYLFLSLRSSVYNVIPITVTPEVLNTPNKVVSWGSAKWLFSFI